MSIAAVGLSTSLLIIVSSLFTGFIRAFEQAAVEAMGDVVLTPPKRIAKYPQFIERLEQTGLVEAATARLSSQGLLHLGKGNVRAVKIWGIECGKRAKVTRFKQALRRQSSLPGEPSFDSADLPDKIGGFVGVGVVAEPAEETDEYDFQSIGESVLGREVVVVTGAQAGSGDGRGTDEDSSSDESGAAAPARFVRKNIPFTVTDVVFSGVYYLDKNLIYLPIEELQKKLYPDEAWPTADQIQIKLAGGADTEVALAVILGVWEEFAATELGWSTNLMRYTEIETSKEMQRQYVVELLKQMGVLLVIFGMVSFGVVVLVFCIFYMIVRLKQKDVGVIKSCGGSSGSVASVFVGFGVFVGMIGSGLGIVLAYIVTKNVNTVEEWIRIIFGLKLWKSSVYMFNRIPNEVNWYSVWIIVLSAISAVVVGALLPAMMAARTRPVNILRYE